MIQRPRRRSIVQVRLCGCMTPLGRSGVFKVGKQMEGTIFGNKGSGQPDMYGEEIKEPEENDNADGNQVAQLIHDKILVVSQI